MEAMCKRVYGLRRVFSKCKKEEDWRKPVNAPRTWKSKVQWGLLGEYDTTAIAEDAYIFEDLANEVVDRLQRRAPVARNLSLADSTAAGLLGDGDGANPEGG